jgi:hypothetical protein
LIEITDKAFWALLEGVEIRVDWVISHEIISEYVSNYSPNKLGS